VMVERPTGSPGRKFRTGVGEVLLGIFAAAGAVGGTPLAGGDPWLHSSTMMLLGSDGAILYVVNPRTNDVSLFDVAKREVVDFVPIGGASPERILQLPGDPNFWVQSPWSLAYFNTSTNRIDRTISIVIGFDMARERAWIGTKTTAMVVDLRSGEVLGQPDLPKKYVRIWIDNSRKPEQESPHP
jgi:YVTN family beta-propeller protein